MPENNARRLILKTTCLHAPFRAYLAYLASGRARHVKTTKKKAVKNNADVFGFPKLGEMGLQGIFDVFPVCSALFLRSHSKATPTANSLQPTAHSQRIATALLTAKDGCR